jgi:hypothetical protein
MAGRFTSAAIFCRFESELILPLPVRNRFTDMGVILTCVDGVTGPASPAARLSIYVDVVQIEISVSELSHSPPVLGGDQFASVTLETQSIDVRVEWRIKQLRIGLSQQVEMRGPMRIVTRRAIRLPDRSMMIGILFQQRRHIFEFPAVFEGHFTVVTAQTRVKGRLFQELWEDGRVSVMTRFTFLSLVCRAMDNLALHNEPFNVHVTVNTQLSRLILKMVGQIRTVRIVALNTIAIQRRMKVTRLSVLLDFFFMARYTKLIPLGDEQLWVPRRVRLVTQDTCSHGYGAVHVLFFHEAVIGVTNQTQILGRISSQHELKITLMRVVATDTITVCNRLVNIVFCLQSVAHLTQFFYVMTQLKLM